LKTEQLSLLMTVVIAFAALAALILTGQAGIRQDLRSVRTDLLTGQAELQKEIRAVEIKLRDAFRTEAWANGERAASSAGNPASNAG